MAARRSVHSDCTVQPDFALVSKIAAESMQVRILNGVEWGGTLPLGGQTMCSCEWSATNVESKRQLRWMRTG